jgi:hypothetical protein
MRLRVGLLLCLFGVIAGVGCRKALAPNVDRNKAPETWITAAPFDTITLDRTGVRPAPGTIPIRFHVYWAGGDQDGGVVGYYWAVVETLPMPVEGTTQRPPLPGPRPSDYHYTTRTDSTFIFTVAEDIPDRQHAFFIYAVDDQGKPDPTPARFIFNALDRFPPLPVFESACATGTVYFFSGGTLQSEVRTFCFTDSLNFNTLPTDTVPSGSRLTFRFHGEVTVLGGVIKGFRYKLDESELQPSDPESLYHKYVVEYHVPAAERDPARLGADTSQVAPGTKVFTLRAVDQANGSRDATRRFQLNFSPETWFAGPDPNVTGAPWVTKLNGEKYALLINGRLPAGGLPGTLMNDDSVRILPAARVPHRTFLEVYQDTVFLRHEFDTVHMASWVIIHNGGFDRDSPYEVHVADGVATLMPCFPGGPPCFPGGDVLTKAGRNGSPIGFRSRITNFLTPNGPLSFTSQSGVYPFFDPNDVLHFPRIAAYHPMFQAGKAYSLQRAEDGDGARDGRVDDGRRIVEFPRDAAEQALRPLVLVFYVNYPPELKTSNFSFRPRVAVVDTFYSQIWDLRLPADDIDPYVSGGPYGGPAAGKTLRLRFTVTGRDTAGAPFTFSDPPVNGVQQRYINVSDVSLVVPPNLATGPVTLTVELCDCSFCEVNQGEGRCITKDIQVYYVRPPSAPATSASRPGLD